MYPSNRSAKKNDPLTLAVSSVQKTFTFALFLAFWIVICGWPMPQVMTPFLVTFFDEWKVTSSLDTKKTHVSRYLVKMVAAEYVPLGFIAFCN
jgi:hypothetical protein